MRRFSPIAFYNALYDKVKAWLVGGTAGAAIAAGALWGVSQAVEDPLAPWVVALVTAGAAQLVGLLVAFMTPEGKAAPAPVVALRAGVPPY